MDPNKEQVWKAVHSNMAELELMWTTEAEFKTKTTRTRSDYPAGTSNPSINIKLELEPVRTSLSRLE